MVGATTIGVGVDAGVAASASCTSVRLIATDWLKPAVGTWPVIVLKLPAMLPACTRL